MAAVASNAVPPASVGLTSLGLTSLAALAPTECVNVLVLGMGGGCDVVVACALAERVRHEVGPSPRALIRSGSN